MLTSRVRPPANAKSCVRTAPLRFAQATLIALLLLSAPAHASRWGMGYGRGVQRISTDKDPTVNGIDLVRIPGRAAMTYSLGVNQLSLYDNSGVLLAGIGTGANQDIAKREAVSRAQKRGETKAYYSYEQLAPNPGSMTRLSILWGSGKGASHDIAAGVLDDDNKPVPVHTELPDAEVSMWGLDLVAGLADWNIGPLQLGFSLEGIVAAYSIAHVPTQGSNKYMDEHQWMRGGVFLHLTPYYEVLPNLVVSARFSIDPLLSPTRLALWGFDRHWLAAGVTLGASYQPFSFLLFEAELEAAVDGLADTGGTLLSASLNAALIVGSD